MNKGSYKAIIVEGDEREQAIVKNLVRIYFKAEQYKIIALSAGQNIYMLWKRMKEDLFETDIIEVIREYSRQAKQMLEGYTREDFSDVYLFFDYDGHQNNLPDSEDGEIVLQQMLENFDNETENGKLYVSYPMVEALRDFVPGQCDAYTSCTWRIEDLTEYKNKSGFQNPQSGVRNYQFPDWAEMLNVFAMRLSCLLERSETIDFEAYREEVSPASIYQKQADYILDGQIFVLSGFPEFLLDYHRKDFWRKHVKLSTLRPKHCEKRR